jgi:hypothetical protein
LLQSKFFRFQLFLLHLHPDVISKQVDPDYTGKKNQISEDLQLAQRELERNRFALSVGHDHKGQIVVIFFPAHDSPPVGKIYTVLFLNVAIFSLYF